MERICIDTLHCLFYEHPSKWRGGGLFHGRVSREKATPPLPNESGGLGKYEAQASAAVMMAMEQTPRKAGFAGTPSDQNARRK